MTLPGTAGTNTYVLQTNGSGVTSWVAATASFTGLTTGDLCTAASGTAIACAGTLSGDVTSPGGTATVTTVAKIQGTTVSGTTGSTNVVFSASPTLTGTITAAAATFSGVITSTVATGTAPFTVASTTNVANLNASSLAGATFAAPGAIGGTTPSSGAFTTLSASSTVSGAGFTTYLASPPAIGGTAAAAGNFTTLGASGATTDTRAPAANTSIDAMILTDTTAATSGNQQYSPRLHFTGQGWKTTATAASQAVDMIEELQPVQGAANPSGNLVWSDSINGGAYSAVMTLSTAGTLTATTFSGSGASLTAIPESALTALSANQVLGSLTAVAPSGLTMPSCSTTASALLWTSGTGFSCNAAVNAAQLGGATFAAPGAIGGTTPGSGAFTTLSASSTVSGTGFSTYLASPPAIGGTSAAAGNFTTLGASGAITDTQAVGATSTNGLVLTDTTAATVGAQKWSPRIHFTGQGWETSTSASQSVDFIEELQPVQGAANPTGNLVWSDSVNGSAYNADMTLTSGGNVGIGTTTPNALLDLGSAAATLGTMRLEGSTSGYVQIQPAVAAGSWTMTLPGSAGTNTYVLQTNGSGVTSWVAGTSSFTGLTTGDLCTATSGTAIACASTLSGDVTSAGGTATVTTVAKVQGTTVSGTTGTTNVVFSASPTLTGTLTAAAATFSGNVGIGSTTPVALLDITNAAVSAAPALTGNYLNVGASTLTDNSTAASGTAANNAINAIAAPTLAATNTSVTTTNAYSLFIGGAPKKGTNNTATNAIALDIAAAAVGAQTNSYGLYVNAQTGATNNYGAVFATGNVGIGTTGPNYKLEVLGYSVLGEVNTQTDPASSASGGMAVSWNYTGGNAESDLWNLYNSAITAFQFKQKTGAATHTDLMTILGNGDVGIGTTAPTRPLDVRTTDATTNGLSSLLELFHMTSGTAADGIGTGLQFAAENSAGNPILAADINGALSSATAGAETGILTFRTGSAGVMAERVRIDQAGNVGIGTTSPVSQFDLGNQGTMQVGGSGSYIGFNAYYNSGWKYHATGYAYYIRHDGSDISINVADSGSAGAAITPTQAVTITSGGNVGIGTTSPAQALTVVGNNGNWGSTAQFSSNDGSSSTVGNQVNITNSVGSWGLLVGFDGSGVATSTFHSPNAGYVINESGGPLYLGVNGAIDMTINSSGLVGIGTTGPATPLEVSGVIQVRDAAVAPDNGYNGALRITRADSTGQYINLVRYGISGWSIGTVYNSSTFAIGGIAGTDSSFNPAFVITTGGNVGIGTTNPAIGQLQVSGTETNPVVLYMNGTNNSSTTTNLFGLDANVNFNPAGASLSAIYGIASQPNISGSSLTISNMYGVFSQLAIGVGYTGTPTNGYGFYSGNPGASSSTPFSNYIAFISAAITNGDGITSGTVNNLGFQINSSTAAAGSGGTIVNASAQFAVPSGSGAGTTTNYGLKIVGNGGSGGAGTTTNYAIYNTSTANNYFAGNVGIGVTPTHILDVETSSSTAFTGYFADTGGTSSGGAGSSGGAVEGYTHEGGSTSVAVYGLADNGGIAGYFNGYSYGVEATTAYSGGYAVSGVNTSSGVGGYFSSSSGYALITGTGNVGIGTTSPSATLDVRGLIADNGHISNGTTFTIASGCGTPGSLTGGATTGSFTAGQAACAPVINLPTAPNGWWCGANDITHPADAFTQTAKSTTSCTLSATVTSADVIVFHSEAY